MLNVTSAAQVTETLKNTARPIQERSLSSVTNVIILAIPQVFLSNTSGDTEEKKLLVVDNVATPAKDLVT